MSHITAHILDTNKGRPAGGVMAILLKPRENNWEEIASAMTDNNGRISSLLPPDMIVGNGVYKMKFLTKEYFDQQSVPTFYPFIEIIFEITSPEHYHIPLLVSPFGYTTYRGS